MSQRTLRFKSRSAVFTALSAAVVVCFVVSAGREPRLLAQVNSLGGQPLHVIRSASRKLPHDPRRILRGRVIGPLGQPVVGAIVNPFGCKAVAKRQMGRYATDRWQGPMPGTDPQATTDNDGRFVIVTGEPMVGVDLFVRCAGMERKKFELVPTGLDEQRLQLGAGATVQGRLVEGNEPLAGTRIGLVQQDRGMDQFVGPFETTTDREGRFTFANLPAETKMILHGYMEDLGPRGALPARTVQTRGNSKLLDLGDVAIERAHRLSGRLVLADGKAVPPHTRVSIYSGDSLEVEMGADGRFSASGVPAGAVRLRVRLPGYRLSDRNRSRNPRQPTLEGRIERDIDDLVVLLEPGQREREPDYPSRKQRKEWDAKHVRFKQARTEIIAGLTDDADTAPKPTAAQELPDDPGNRNPRKPLAKIEVPPREYPKFSAPEDDVPKRMVTGRVIDRSGRPVANAEVWLPVNWPYPEAVLTAHTSGGLDGRFIVKFPLDWMPKPPALVIATVWAYAPGYSIGTVGVFDQIMNRKDAKPCKIELGPPGDRSFVVRDPAGKPLPGARVYPSYFQALENLYQPVPAELLAKAAAVSDNQGRATLAAFSAKRFDSVRVAAAGFGLQSFSTQVSHVQKVGGPVDYEEQIEDLVLRPVGSAEIRLLAAQPELFSDTYVELTSDYYDIFPTEGHAQGYVDPHGVLRVGEIAIGDLSVAVRTDKRLPVRPRLPARREFEIAVGQTTTIEIPLEPAVQVHGVLRVKETEEPIGGVKISLGYGVGQSEQAMTDDDGRYSAYILPGDVKLHVITLPGKYVQLGRPWEEKHPVPDGKTDFELPPIEVVPAIEVPGRVIDSHGDPLAGVRIRGRIGELSYGIGQSDENGRFTLYRVPAGMKLNGYVASSRELGRVTLAIESTDPLILRVE